MLRDDFVEHAALDRLTGYAASALNVTLGLRAQAGGRPLVPPIDDTDALEGDSLLAVVRQRRTEFHRRSGGFPQCVILCGLRDMDDYEIYSANDCRTGRTAGTRKSTGRSRCGASTGGWKGRIAAGLPPRRDGSGADRTACSTAAA